MRLSRIAVAVLSILASSGTESMAQEDSLAIPSADPVPHALELSGSIEPSYSLSMDRSDSPLFLLSKAGATASGFSASYPLDLYLDGDYQNGGLGIHLKTHTSYQAGAAIGFALDEAYGEMQLSDSLLIMLGAKIYNWGNGYAFNPAGFVNPAKDPENPDAVGQGILSGSIEVSKSLSRGILNNFSLDLIAIPPVSASTAPSGDILDTDLAVKLYLLALDTDLDFMGYWSGSAPVRIGMDFSRNILPSLEVHGEAAYSFGQSLTYMSSGTPLTASVDSLSYLGGLRWLNALNMTSILEFYHDDAGMTANDYEGYLAYLRSAMASGNAALVSQARSDYKSLSLRPSIERDYIYFKLSWPEPFDIVDFTPAVSAVYSADDGSAMAAISLSYTPFTNFEVDMSPAIFLGPASSQYGSKPSATSLAMQAKFHF